MIVDPLKRTDGEYVFSQNTKSRIRGAASGGYSKKSFTVSLYDDAYEDKVDATVLGMRDDDGWILDAMYADHARMRNRFCLIFGTIWTICLTTKTLINFSGQWHPRHACRDTVQRFILRALLPYR